MTAAEYAAARDAHRAEVGPWVADRAARKSRGEAHPVWDFLFEYYAFKPSHLLRYSPGLGVTLTGVEAAALDWGDHYTPSAGGRTLDPAAFPARRVEYLRWAVDYLARVAEREPFYGCFGLHEWAMVYRDDHVRHGRVPLRLARAGTDAVVEAGALMCTHFDAFRFFTPAAAPRNRVQLRRPLAPDHDQPGCVHANMDLYKFAFKIAPFVSSAALAAAFRVAAQARELDMRASPYDLSGLGFAAIAIETRAGREEYVAGQRRVAAAAAPVRAAVLAEYAALLRAVAGTSPPGPLSDAERGSQRSESAARTRPMDRHEGHPLSASERGPGGEVPAPPSAHPASTTQT